LEDALRRGGLRITDRRGVIYNLLADKWQLSTDMDVNYMLTAEQFQ
jgi:2-polyprenyl-6-hydroxyphenyl methylase/3-demethylubiquinone-9 3-methyltransferase